MFISETHRRTPCDVNPFRVRQEVERMAQAGWALMAREPADETVSAREVMLVFQKADA
jgi:hypothetical protein